MNRDLLIEAREAMVILLTFFEDVTSEDITLPFISNSKKLREFTKNYDLEYVYRVYEKLNDLKG